MVGGDGRFPCGDQESHRLEQHRPNIQSTVDLECSGLRDAYGTVGRPRWLHMSAGAFIQSGMDKGGLIYGRDAMKYMAKPVSTRFAYFFFSPICFLCTKPLPVQYSNPPQLTIRGSQLMTNTMHSRDVVCPIPQRTRRHTPRKRDYVRLQSTCRK